MIPDPLLVIRNTDANNEVLSSKRTTLKDLAYEFGVAKITLLRPLKESKFGRHTNAINYFCMCAHSVSRWSFTYNFYMFPN
jgi:hypothetical protein